jgi:hypothetical protein
MSTYTMGQLGVGQGGLECQKGWPHSLQRLILQIDGGIGALETVLEIVGQ